MSKTIIILRKKKNSVQINYNVNVQINYNIKTKIIIILRKKKKKIQFSRYIYTPELAIFQIPDQLNVSLKIELVLYMRAH